MNNNMILLVALIIVRFVMRRQMEKRSSIDKGLHHKKDLAKIGKQLISIMSQVTKHLMFLGKHTSLLRIISEFWLEIPEIW